MRMLKKMIAAGTAIIATAMTMIPAEAFCGFGCGFGLGFPFFRGFGFGFPFFGGLGCGFGCGFPFFGGLGCGLGFPFGGCW